MRQPGQFAAAIQDGLARPPARGRQGDVVSSADAVQLANEAGNDETNLASEEVVEVDNAMRPAGPAEAVEKLDEMATRHGLDQDDPGAK